MIIFVLLNILCFIIILCKCIWADKASWNRTTHNMISVFTSYHPQVELINLTEEEKVSEAAEATEDDCENCSRYNSEGDDNSSDENPLSDSSISTPSIVNTEAEILEEAEVTKNIDLVNPENYSGGDSGGGSESDDSVVILENRANYFKQAKEIVQGLKDELEKKND